MTSLPAPDHADAFDDRQRRRVPLGSVTRAALVREAGAGSRIRAHHLRRVLTRMGIDTVDLLHLIEPGVPDALALAGGPGGVGPLDLIVALTPQVEVDAARVAVQSDASLARLRHAHPTATLRRLLATGQIARYATLTAQTVDQDHLVVDHVIMQAEGSTIGVRIGERPLPDGQVVQVVAANPLAGLPRSPSLDPLAIGTVTVLSGDGGSSHGHGLEANQQLWCAGEGPVDVHIDGRRCASPEREVTIRDGARDLKLVVVDETGA